MIIHLLDGGLPLCRFTHEAPGFWPPGHMWARAAERMADWPPDTKMCPECARVAKGSPQERAPESQGAGSACAGTLAPSESADDTGSLGPAAGSPAPAPTKSDW